jgi:hypothetical protein
LQGEGIWQVPDFAHGTVVEQNLDDIEANFDGWISEKPQIVQGRLRKQTPFSSVNGVSRTNPIFVRPGLYFDEHEAILVAANQVNLAALRRKVRGQEFQPQSLKVFSGCAFAEFTANEVPGFFCFLEPRP